MGWRLTVRREHSEEIHDLPDVQALRRAVMALRADPSVTRYEFVRLTAPEQRQQCRCGWAYYPRDVSVRPCRCGVQHVDYRCPECQTNEAEPGRGEGCGPLPFDVERWSSRDWDTRQRAR